MDRALVIVSVTVFGVAVTLTVSRLLRVRLTVQNFLFTVLGTAVFSGVVTALAYIAFTSWSCPADTLCDYPGMFGGGVAFGAVWLSCFGVVYMAAALLLARSQSRSETVGSALTPYTSLERTRDR